MSLRRVAIATPSMDGRVDAGYAAALAGSVKHCLAHGIELLPLFVCYDAKLHLARNDLLAMAMAAPDVSDLVWIDADIEWQPEWIQRLLVHPVDVVGGTYPRKADGAGYEVGAPADGPAVPGLLPVSHLGTGFLRLSRTAFAALWDAAPPYRAPRGEQRLVFRWDIAADGQPVGEDVGMCHQLRALGFAIHLDPTMTCVHVGTKRWRADFASTLLKAVDRDA